MTDHKPFFKKLEDEFVAFLDLWKRKRGLAIIGIFIISALFIIGTADWYNRGINIKNLENEKAGLINDLNLMRLDNKSLREIVAPLLKQAAEKFPGEEINVSLKKLIELLQGQDSKKQLIRTATVTVEVNIESDEQINTKYMDQGGYFAFGKEKEALLIMSNTECSARQNGNKQVLYRGVFSMDAAHPANGKPLSFLAESEYIQIRFMPMPHKSKVLGGKAICIFNSQERLEIDIPEQQMVDEKIVVRRLHDIDFFREIEDKSE